MCLVSQKDFNKNTEHGAGRVYQITLSGCTVEIVGLCFSWILTHTRPGTIQAFSSSMLILLVSIYLNCPTIVVQLEIARVSAEHNDTDIS